MMTTEDTEQLKQDLMVADCPDCCEESFRCLPKKKWKTDFPLWRCSECGYEEDRFEQVNWGALVRLFETGPTPYPTITTLNQQEEEENGK